MMPKTTRKYAPDHFVPQARPRHTPAASRHGRQPSDGPHAPSAARPARSRPATLRARTFRDSSRSMSRKQNAANAQNMRMRSSSPVRECTKWCPSNARIERGDGAQQRRPEQPARGPADHEDRQDAQDAYREPPAEAAVDPEQLLAPADEPLADRRVDDEVTGGRVVDLEDVAGGEVLVDLLGVVEDRVVAHLDAEQDHRPALLDVVRLVEDQLVRVAEVPEPQDAADDGGDQRADPPEQHVPAALEGLPEQAAAHLPLGLDHGVQGMRRAQESPSRLPASRPEVVLNFGTESPRKLATTSGLEAVSRS